MTQCPLPARLFVSTVHSLHEVPRGLQTGFVPSPHICSGWEAFKTVMRNCPFDPAAGADTSSPFHSPGNLSWPCGPTHAEQDRARTSSPMLPSPVVLPPLLFTLIWGEGLGKMAIGYFISLRIGAFESKIYMKMKEKEDREKIEITRPPLHNYICACLPSQSSFEAKILFNSVFSIRTVSSGT